jgi:hypothetical protein
MSNLVDSIRDDLEDAVSKELIFLDDCLKRKITSGILDAVKKIVGKKADCLEDEMYDCKDELDSVEDDLDGMTEERDDLLEDAEKVKVDKALQRMTESFNFYAYGKER